MQKSSIDIYDGNKSRRRKKRTKSFLFSCDNRILEEMQWDLSQDILERVLARLPVSCFFQYRSVCKGWSSLVYSPSFLKACSEVSSRKPWFYMFDSKHEDSFVYDTEVNGWHRVKHLNKLKENSKLKPVASAGGLVCFISVFGKLIVCNPLTSCFRELPPYGSTETVHAIAMLASQGSYKVVAICGEFPTLLVKVFDSTEECWIEPSICLRKEEAINGKVNASCIVNLDDSAYYLNKGGSVVSRNVWRTTSKEFSSVLTLAGNGRETLYFLNKAGKIVSCNIQKGTWNELPPLLLSTSEYSIDLVNCGGRMLAVVLHEMMETASVRIWEYNDSKAEWVHILAMHPSLSHEYFGKKADINCVGYNNLIMICISSYRLNKIVLCDIGKQSWLELPRCHLPGSRKTKRFLSAYPFEPRLDAAV